MPTFQITTDDATYTQGSSTDAFRDLGHDSVTLQSFDHEGDYVVLNYGHGLTLTIPEGRVQRIANAV